MNKHLPLARVCLLVLIIFLFTGNRIQARQQQHTDTLSTAQAVALVDMLDASLSSLAAQDLRGRRIGGYVMLGLGIGAGVGGVTTLAVGTGDDAKIVGYSLIGGGALLGGLSLLPFKIKSESERLYDEFSMATRERSRDVRQTYLYWDQRFGEFAEKTRRDRMVGGISSMAVGVVTGIAVSRSSSVDRVEASMWAAMGPILGGISSLLIKSEAERRYETYQRAKEGLIGRGAATQVNAGVLPIPNGGFAVVQVRF